MIEKNIKEGWSRHYRNDRGIWEDICPHGVGHCDDVHGCDGCCAGLYHPLTQKEMASKGGKSHSVEHMTMLSKKAVKARKKNKKARNKANSYPQEDEKKI